MSAYLVFTIVRCGGRRGTITRCPPVTIWDHQPSDVFPGYHAACSLSGQADGRYDCGGERLFRARFKRVDGARRPGPATGDSKPDFQVSHARLRVHENIGPDAGSCACHNQRLLGGSGRFVPLNAIVGCSFDGPSRRFRSRRSSERAEQYQRLLVRARLKCSLGESESRSPNCKHR